MNARTFLIVSSLFLVTVACFSAEVVPDLLRDRWITAQDGAPGPKLKAEKEAVQAALRKCVEQACGVYIRSQSKSRDYKLIYNKVMANTPGYVLEYKVLKVWEQDGITWARVSALVSSKKFEEEWVRIAHTVHQEGNPRVIIVISESTLSMVNELAEETKKDEKAAIAAAASGTTTVTAAEIARARSLRERYVWVDRRGRRWRQRGGGQVYAVDGAVAEREAVSAARAHFEAVFAAVAAMEKTKSREVWKKAAEKIDEKGTVQTAVEEFFIKKGIKLVDRTAAKKVDKRDLMLVASGGSPDEIAAIKSRFNADVIIMGTAAAEYGGKIDLAGVPMYRYSSKLVARAVRTDSGQLLAAKTVGPMNATSMKRSGGEDEALAKLAEKAAPEILAAVVEAWRKQVNVSRDIKLYVSGMTFDDWKAFREETLKLKGVQAVRLREITKSVATIDVEYDFDAQNLADRLTELKNTRLQVTELNPNRLKLKMVK
jgi:hypothetical protein